MTLFDHVELIQGDSLRKYMYIGISTCNTTCNTISSNLLHVVKFCPPLPCLKIKLLIKSPEWVSNFSQQFWKAVILFGPQSKIHALLIYLCCSNSFSLTLEKANFLRKLIFHLEVLNYSKVKRHKRR